MSKPGVPIAALLAPDGAVSRRLPGFEIRPQQLQMAEAVAAAMAGRERLLVEAGTGVGKSFAYLLPAISRIVEHGERVVVSTHTIALQEQLVQKDIPLLQSLIGEFSAVLVKGRNNYVSLRRLGRALAHETRLFGEDDLRHALHRLEAWAASTSDGSRASLPMAPPPEVWEAVQSDSDNCMGRRCPRYKECFYQIARRRMDNGNLLVCNHALFFSDLALRAEGGGFLPPYDHVILDEAHTVEDVAADHFGQRLSEGQVGRLLRSLHHERSGKGLLTTIRTDGEGRGAQSRAAASVERCREASEAFFERLRELHAESGERQGRITAPMEDRAGLGPALRELRDLLRFLREHAASEEDRLECASLANRAGALAGAAEELLGQTLEGCVYWVEVSAARRRSRARTGRAPVGRTSLCAAPIDVAPILRERLFGQPVSVTLSSATLATGPGDFRHVQTALGCEDAPTLQLGSPFDYARSMKVYAERDLPSPDQAGFVDALCPRILEHLRATDGGAFVLFTSFSMLGQIVERLRPALAAAGHPVLVHGEAQERSVLIEQFRRNERSVLFGVSSFWQGVDVRGRALRNVIIVRLPFEPPDQPLVQARHELIAARGGNPFRDDALPKAVLRFKQGVGRLVRSSSDEGRVVVLDPRFLTKWYGRWFRKALPEGVTIERRLGVS